jgi:hypothetical protein
LYTNEIVEVLVNKSVIRSNIGNMIDENNRVKEFCERVVGKWAQGHPHYKEEARLVVSYSLL